METVLQVVNDEPIRHGPSVRTAAFSPDGKTILTGSTDKSARLWEVDSGKPVGSPLLHEGLVIAVAFSPDGNTVLTASMDRTARLWQTATGKPVAKPFLHAMPVRAAAFSPDGETLLTASGNSAYLWEAVTGRMRRRLVHLGLVREVSAAAFSPDGKRIVTGILSKAPCLWDSATGALLSDSR